ncbi:cytochrome P450 71D9-like [Prosopis cineraria]|uniref:cytochrome P450 71D9-like n=1 Tax=Prosopis cineraria TaxID=364024 RepID=UPI00240F2EB4|nr:cytochrome P450 71D9-like [Prosopis cineraria]
MEIQIPYSILFTFFCLFLLILKPSRFKRSNKTLPPGPWKLPIIGNLHQMAGPSLPHHTMRDLADKYGPLIHLQLGETSNIIVSSPEMAKEVMKTHDQIFANRPYFLATDIVGYKAIDVGFAPYGHYWRQLRKVVTLELLSLKRVQSFRAIKGREDSITLERTMELATGLSVADLFPSLKFLPVITGLKAKLEKLHQVGDSILQEVLTEHREKNMRRSQDANEAYQDDLVDVLLRIQKENDLEIHVSDDTIKSIIQVISLTVSLNNTSR